MDNGGVLDIGSSNVDYSAQILAQSRASDVPLPPAREKKNDPIEFSAVFVREIRTEVEFLLVAFFLEEDDETDDETLIAAAKGITNIIQNIWGESCKLTGETMPTSPKVYCQQQLRLKKILS